MKPSQPIDPNESEEPQEYEVKDAADTLMKAEEIKKNKKLMPHVHKHLAKKMGAIKSLQDLKDYRDKMISESANVGKSSKEG